MARAPRPGTTGNGSGTNGIGPASQTFEIVVRGEKVRLSTDQLGARDDALVRRECLKTYGYKQSLYGALSEVNSEDTLGLDTVVLMWWLARKKAGEPDLTLNQALDEFPSYGELERDPDVIGMDVVEPDGEDEDAGSPEASGASSAPPGRTSPTSTASTRGTSRTSRTRKSSST